jgi:hypothetical protein
MPESQSRIWQKFAWGFMRNQRIKCVWEVLKKDWWPIVGPIGRVLRGEFVLETFVQCVHDESWILGLGRYSGSLSEVTGSLAA